MKILLISDFFLSGQTTHVMDLAEQLQELGHSVHVRFTRVHSSLFKSEYSPRLKKLGIQFSTGLGSSSLTYMARTWHPDIVHAHSSTQFSLAHRLASRLRIPYVLTCHGLGFSHPKYKQDLEAAAHVIAIGPNVASEIKSICKNLTIIPNGINTEHYVPPQGGMVRNQVVYIGRIDSSKIPGINQLALVLNRYFNRNLTVIGDWNPEVPGTIFQPWKTDLLPTLQQAGIVAACGRTAREALACGNAVLLMQKYYDGLVSPALTSRPDFDFSGNQGRFSFYRLRKDLKKLLSSPNALQKLQTWSRHYAVQHLSSASMATQIAQIYAAVRDQPTPRPKYLERLTW